MNQFRQFSLLGLFVVSGYFAQTRVNDKDIQTLMENLKEDARTFRSSFDSAIEKSTIRNTSKEKEAKDLVERFQKQTEDLLDQFKDDQKTHGKLGTALSSADQIDRVLSDVHLSGQTTSNWRKVRSELRRLSDAFGSPGS